MALVHGCQTENILAALCLCSTFTSIFFVYMQAEHQTTVQDLGKAREQLTLLHTSVLRASSESEASEREKKKLEHNLKAMTQSLEEKQEELAASKVSRHLICFYSSV